MTWAHGLGTEVGEETVSQIEPIVLGRGFQGMQKGPQRRQLPEHGQALERGHTRCGRKTRQGLEPGRGNPAGAGYRQTQRADLFDATEGGPEGRDTLPDRATTESLAGGSAVAGRDVAEGRQLGLWRRAEATGQHACDAHLDARTQARHQACQHTDAGEQDFVAEESRGGALEQHARTIGSGPAERIEPPLQPELHAGDQKIRSPIHPSNLGGMLPPLVAGPIPCQTRRIGDPQWLRARADNTRGDRRWVREKGSQEPHCPQLDGKAQTIRQPTAPGQVRLIGIIQMDILGYLDGRGFPHIAAIVLFWTLGEKADGHTIHSSQDRIRSTPPFCITRGTRTTSQGRCVQKSVVECRHCAKTCATRQGRERGPGMRMGYARVSTEEQQRSIQLELLQQAGCTRVFQEKRSGMMRERPVLLQLLEQLREGDTVVVWQLDRLARSTRDLLELVERIHTAGARFQSLTEPWADTTSHVGKCILTVFAGLAEFERDLIRERARVGRVAAQRRGVRFGRPPQAAHRATRLSTSTDDGRARGEGDGPTVWCARHHDIPYGRG